VLERINPERCKLFQGINLKDAVDAGAEAMVYIYPFCQSFLGKQADELGLKSIFLSELCSMALGEMAFPGYIRTQTRLPDSGQVSAGNYFISSLYLKSLQSASKKENLI